MEVLAEVRPLRGPVVEALQLPVVGPEEVVELGWPVAWKAPDYIVGLHTGLAEVQSYVVVVRHPEMEQVVH